MPKTKIESVRIALIGLFTNPNKDSWFEPKEINDPHYHANCELEEYCIPFENPYTEKINGVLVRRLHKFEGFKCKTHNNVVVHKDGWEVGWWGGTDSKKIWEDATRIDIQKRNKAISLAKQKLKVAA